MNKTNSVREKKDKKGYSPGLQVNGPKWQVAYRHGKQNCGEKTIYNARKFENVGPRINTLGRMTSKPSSFSKKTAGLCGRGRANQQ